MNFSKVWNSLTYKRIAYVVGCGSFIETIKYNEVWLDVEPVKRMSIEEMQKNVVDTEDLSVTSIAKEYGCYVYYPVHLCISNKVVANVLVTSGLLTLDGILSYAVGAFWPITVPLYAYHKYDDNKVKKMI